MKKYKAIMFDMDGTLIPMDVKAFSEGYFYDLHKKLASGGHDYDHAFLVKAIWTGTGAMVKNDGSCYNTERFWQVFKQMLNEDDATMKELEALCDDFYSHEFMEAKRFTGDNPLAVKAVWLAHQKADQVILATNPLFPMAGQITRMKWVDLRPEDFDLVTAYETDTYCKPNPKYFESVCERAGVTPNECLMIGNDENEDMYSASSVGMDCYLVTGSDIPCAEHPWTGRRGSFDELIEFLKGLPD